MEDQLVPRRVVFPSSRGGGSDVVREPLDSPDGIGEGSKESHFQRLKSPLRGSSTGDDGEGGGATSAPGAATPSNARVGIPPLLAATDSTVQRLSSSSGSAIAAAAPTPATSPTAVVLATAGQAHVSCLTADGRLWMLGMRGRGVEFDDSPALVAAAGGLVGCVAPLAIRRDEPPAALPSSPLDPSGKALNGLSGGLSPQVPVPELFMQTEPLEVNAAALGGRRVRSLRSSTHHSYAVMEDGAVFRWGWAGIVLPVGETAGLAVRDVAFGHCHAVVMG